MRGRQIHAVKHRLNKEKQACGGRHGRLFQNQNAPCKLRIQLWNALIRSTLTYALQTHQITSTREKLDNFAQECMGGIIDSAWYLKTNSGKHKKTHKNTHSQHRQDKPQTQHRSVEQNYIQELNSQQ